LGAGAGAGAHASASNKWMALFSNMPKNKG